MFLFRISGVVPYDLGSTRRRVGRGEQNNDRQGLVRSGKRVGGENETVRTTDKEIIGQRDRLQKGPETLTGVRTVSKRLWKRRKEEREGPASR